MYVCDRFALIYHHVLHVHHVCIAQIYEIEAKLVLDPTQVKPGKRDFAAAMRDLTPAAHRYTYTAYYIQYNWYYCTAQYLLSVRSCSTTSTAA
jgi:hypothetical protein